MAFDAGADDYFGRSVAISGDTIVIGSPFDDDVVVNMQGGSGSAYVFVRADGDWTRTNKLTAASDAGAGDMFGYSVAISGDTIVIGSHRDDDNNQVDSGSAYVFVRAYGDWTQQAKLTAASDAGSSDYFGYSVAVSGDTIVIGSY